MVSCVPPTSREGLLVGRHMSAVDYWGVGSIPQSCSGES